MAQYVILHDSQVCSRTLLTKLMGLEKTVTPNPRFSTLMQLLFSFDQDMRFEKSLIQLQTFACQLSSTLMQLLFSFDQDIRVEKTLIQTLASQLPSILMQFLFSFQQDTRVEKTLIKTLPFQLSCNSCSRLSDSKISTKRCNYKIFSSPLSQITRSRLGSIKTTNSLFPVKTTNVRLLRNWFGETVDRTFHFGKSILFRYNFFLDFLRRS